MTTLHIRLKDGTQLISMAEHYRPQDERLLLAQAENPEWLAGMFAQLRAREEFLMEHTTREQRSIGWGGFVAITVEASRLGDHLVSWAGRGTPPVTIYGELYTRARLRKAERDTGVSEGEVREAMAGAGEAHGAGWRYGMWYSSACRAGEPDFNHIGHMTPITQGQFYAARRDGWPREVPRRK
jgi:hypothetical protein